MSLARRLLAVAGSQRSAVVLLLLLCLLTWLGTLHQVDHGLHAAQQRYFDSLYLMQPLWGSLAIPLPGGYLLMALLFVNLLVGGLLRIQWARRTAGILIVHVGIALLLVAGFVKFHFANEGFLRLYEGEQAGMYEDYILWEVAISQREADGSVTEYLIDEGDFRRLGPGDWRRFEHPALPVAIELSQFLVNSTPMPKGPMFDAPTPVVDGWFLQPEDPRTKAEQNVAGLHVRVAGQPQRAGLLWGANIPPWTIELEDGGAIGVSLRHRRYPLPFILRLDDFHHEFHPGTRTARVYRSDVTVLPFQGAPVTQRIEMNEPLRRNGIVAFQASYGPAEAGPGETMYSVFAVVRNPSDSWPLISCIVIAIGLVWHFGLALVRHIRRLRREEVPT